jgi:tellurite resistance protein TerC
MENSIGSPLFLGVFIAVVLFLLSLDLGIFHRKAHAVSVREALLWSIAWVLMSVSFGSWVFWRFGSKAGLEFYAGYLIEYALSVDNVFVFILLFSYFAVPAKLHHRVLFWGILGALIMRASFILAGAMLLQAFHWVIYGFGLFLVYTGFKILRHGETKVEPDKNPVVRLFQRFIPLASGYESGGFFVHGGGKWLATPLALVLITVETTDLVFAVDSIPAIFAVTRDPFIVYTSNICAILGLRSMYFLLAAVIGRFVYLSTGLGVVLMFVGWKMLLGDIYHIPITASLSVVAIVLIGSVVLSLVCPPRQTPAAAETSNPLDGLVTSETQKDREEK